MPTTRRGGLGESSGGLRPFRAPKWMVIIIPTDSRSGWPAGREGRFFVWFDRPVRILCSENPVQYHDFHATLLALLGLDHEKLTYRHAGRDFRLTDAAGRVVNEIFA